ncbi:hypothetical protein R1flu_011640 [Riccia fluitans]|uniref:Uncharacterized protein n=1 Tax=Riccia fluitans TaxID=41844 RepID=A0ABD1Z8D4_9MARC
MNFSTWSGSVSNCVFYSRKRCLGLRTRGFLRAATGGCHRRIISQEKSLEIKFCVVGIGGKETLLSREFQYAKWLRNLSCWKTSFFRILRFVQESVCLRGTDVPRFNTFNTRRSAEQLFRFRKRNICSILLMPSVQGKEVGQTTKVSEIKKKKHSEQHTALRGILEKK